MNKQKFIIENINVIDEFDTTDIFKKIYNKVFYQTTGFYLDKDGAFDYITVSSKDGHSSNKWKLEYNLSIAENIQRLKNALEDKNIKFEDFKTFYAVGGIFRSYYLRRSEKSFSLHKDGGISSLFYFLRYLTTNVIDENLKEANEFLEEKKIRWNEGAYECELNGLKIKQFLNGRLDIKGLTVDQEKQIDKFLAINDVLQYTHKKYASR